MSGYLGTVVVRLVIYPSADSGAALCCAVHGLNPSAILRFCCSTPHVFIPLIVVATSKLIAYPKTYPFCGMAQRRPDRTIRAPRSKKCTSHRKHRLHVSRQESRSSRRARRPDDARPIRTPRSRQHACRTCASASRRVQGKPAPKSMRSSMQNRVIRPSNDGKTSGVATFR